MAARYDKEKYKGYKTWRNGSRQWIHTEKDESLADVVRFMRDALKYYGRDDLTFDEKKIIQAGKQTYIVTLRSIKTV